MNKREVVRQYIRWPGKSCQRISTKKKRLQEQLSPIFSASLTCSTRYVRLKPSMTGAAPAENRLKSCGGIRAGEDK